MKLVINGFAGAGTVEMGGFDYHGRGRAFGENRDFLAGECIGACLEYAAINRPDLGKTPTPVMIYVCSDGSLVSDGSIDDSMGGRGKGNWTSDNSSTAGSFFLVYNPGGRPQLLGGTVEEQERHRQIGYMSMDGSVITSATPAANNVNLLVNTVILNYMALHGEQNRFASEFPNNGLGNNLDDYVAFAPIVNGTIGG
jgi:hypothetical protein